MSEEIENFASIIDEWKFGYTSILKRYFVAKFNGEKQLIHCLIAFTNENLSHLSNIQIETDHCIAGRELQNFSINEYDAIMKNLRENNGTVITLQGSFSLSSAPSIPLQIYFDPIHYPLLNPTYRSPYVRIGGGIRGSYIDPKIIDLELKCLDTPYDNFHDLAFDLALPADLLTGNTTPHLDILCGNPFSDRTYEIKNKNTLNLSFTFPNSPDHKDFKVGLRCFDGTVQGSRQAIKGEEFTWLEKDGKTIAYITKEFPGLEYARVLPSYKGKNLGSEMIADPHILLNQRLEVHNALFPQKSIEDLLNARHQDEFELGVSLLLHSLRLSVLNYTVSDAYTEAPDVIAVSVTGHVYVIECTTGTPDNKGKMQKLFERYEKIKKSLETKGFNSATIRPVVITSLLAENVHASRAQAANLNISLLTKEDLVGLLSRIQNPPSDIELFDASLQAIPVIEIPKTV